MARTEQPTSSTRLLFLLDADYGSLTFVMYLLFGQRIARQATVLLPVKLAANMDQLPARTLQYHSYQEVRTMIESEKPDIVFLVCGLLLSTYELFSIRELVRLIRFLHSRGCRVVTTDILAGLGPQLANLKFGTPYLNKTNLRTRLFAWRLERYVMRQVRKSYAVMKTLPIVYAVPPDSLVMAQDSQCVSFYNPKISATHNALESAVEPGRGGEKPLSWVFVLAKTDYEVQTVLRGHGPFANTLASRLREVARAGRTATVIAPEICLDAVAERLSGESSIRLVSFCPFSEFSSLLLTAEYAFFWNIGSASMLLRQVSGKPIFFFDQGHYARMSQALHDRTLELYYPHWAPIYLDPDEPLSLEGLKPRADEYAQSALRMREHFQTSPSPDELVAELLALKIPAR